MKNILLAEEIETHKKYAIKASDYFTCFQFDGDEINGEPYQVLNKADIKVIGEIDENGEITEY